MVYSYADGILLGDELVRHRSPLALRADLSKEVEGNSGTPCALFGEGWISPMDDSLSVSPQAALSSRTGLGLPAAVLGAPAGQLCPCALSQLDARDMYVYSQTCIRERKTYLF